MEAERKPLLDTFDWLILIGAIPVQSAPLFVAAVLLVIVRRWPRFCRDVLSMCGVQEVKAWHCKVFPGAAHIVMSNEKRTDDTNQVVAKQLPSISQEAGQPIATLGNRVNGGLTGNSVTRSSGNDLLSSPDLSEARKILLRQGGVTVLANLIKAGLIDQTVGIEAGFRVKRSGRPESDYAQIRAMLQPLAEKPKYPDLTPEQKQLREEMGV